MAFAKKEKVIKQCAECGTDVSMQPWRVQYFKFCSEKCQYAAKKKIVPHNKLSEDKKILKYCQNPECNKTYRILPSDFKLGRYKYCSHKCAAYVNNDSFFVKQEEKFIEHEEVVNQELFRQIWFL